MSDANTSPKPKTKYGLTAAEWADALNETRRALTEVASSDSTITYGELARRVGAGRLSARSAGLGVLLGEICATEDAERGVMLGSVVVRADSGMPGHGYFRHAAELGRDVSDPEAFWRSEVERVWRSYSK